MFFVSFFLNYSLILTSEVTDLGEICISVNEFSSCILLQQHQIVLFDLIFFSMFITGLKFITACQSPIEQTGVCSKVEEH